MLYVLLWKPWYWVGCLLNQTTLHFGNYCHPCHIICVWCHCPAQCHIFQWWQWQYLKTIFSMVQIPDSMYYFCLVASSVFCAKYTCCNTSPRCTYIAHVLVVHVICYFWQTTVTCITVNLCTKRRFKSPIFVVISGNYRWICMMQ